MKKAKEVKEPKKIVKKRTSESSWGLLISRIRQKEKKLNY
jgi:hypothetical protein